MTKFIWHQLVCLAYTVNYYTHLVTHLVWPHQQVNQLERPRA